jgi:DNA recombination protein RmuC
MLEAGLIAVVIIQIMMIFYLTSNKRGRADSQATNLLKTDMNKLSDDVNKLREGLSEKLSDRLDKNQEMMLKSLQKQFAQSSKLIADVSSNLTEIKESNKQVVSVTDELKTLQNILQNPKQRGVLGEYYLQSVLENVLPPERFAMQYKFKNGDIVDAVIHLDKNKILPVDSKFTLENYNRLVDEKDKAKREKLAAAFKTDLKNRIDETSKYIKPDENTLDHAFMFIPSEAIYYDLLANKVGATDVSARDLIEYAFREKKVVIVSPTTFLAYLQTVIQGLRSLQIEEKAKDIQKNVGQLGRHMSVYNDYMLRLGKSLGTTVNHFNNAHKELGKLDKDVVKIAESNPAVEPLLIEKPSANEQE